MFSNNFTSLQSLRYTNDFFRKNISKYTNSLYNKTNQCFIILKVEKIKLKYKKKKNFE